MKHLPEMVHGFLHSHSSYVGALTRQANEAIRIKNCEKSEILNSKSQFNHPPISRIVVEKSKKTKANSLNQKNRSCAWQNVRYRR